MSSRRHFWGKLTRHACVSMGATAVHQLILTLLLITPGWRGTTANLVAITLTTPPSYLVNRSWVWKVRDRDKMFADAVPFWLSAVLGLFLSTVFIAFVESHFSAKWMINVASILAWDVIWLARFFFLESMLTRRIVVTEPVAN